MDWYKSAKEILPGGDLAILTDLVQGEGYKKLIDQTDKVYRLVILDKFLFTNQSKIGNIWRNILKFSIFPVQVWKVKAFSRKNPHAVYYAHAMYYLVLAWAADIPFVGTPQGSDILLKPDKSRLFKWFAINALKKAKAVTCDSMKMKEKIAEFTGVNASLIQNGIDVEEVQKLRSEVTIDRQLIVSPRGLTSLYRIEEIIKGRNAISNLPFINFIYPFSDNDYISEIRKYLLPNDILSGRLDRGKMYRLLIETKLVISIPKSDSSPRSVYEAIFCGAAVAITYNPYYDTLPHCMKERIIIVDLSNRDWFYDALCKADEIVKLEFIPTSVALEKFDQRESFKQILKLLF